MPNLSTTMNFSSMTYPLQVLILAHDFSVHDPVGVSLSDVLMSSVAPVTLNLAQYKYKWHIAPC